jgi:hypothetical protein
MRRNILFIAILLCGQTAFGQNSVYGKYIGTVKLFDSLRITFQLSLRQDGSYTMKSSRKDSSITESGKWRLKSDKIKLKPESSKAEKQYALQRTFVLNIEGNSLIWKPNYNKRKFEKEMNKAVGENVTLADKSKPLILYKNN